jgi:hypothetical protein
MIPLFPNCHTPVIQYDDQYRCWMCHLWLKKDQVIILEKKEIQEEDHKDETQEG